LSSTEPEQEQSQYTWSVALEDTMRITPDVDVVGGISYDNYQITKAEEFTPAAGLFENPKGGADAVNWQAAVLWRHASSGEWHASISDRARFPVIFELYSTRFGTATPNPDLGPERATNVEVGWRRLVAGRARLEAAVFRSDVRDLIQTVVLPNSTTQTQNVGNGNFSGFEFSADAPVGSAVRAGGNYTFTHRELTDALQPNLRPTGVPTNRAFLYATWQPVSPLRITPSLELADDRWSDVNPAPAPPAIPYVKTGGYALLDLDATYAFGRGLASADFRGIELSLGFKNLLDDHYELAWGYPQPGRTFYVKTRMLY
jgi:iron complex outermembrane receptor protein